jgi:hypothetical protein
VPNQKAIQVRKNAFQGAKLERQIERALQKNLRFNVEAQQVHGARRPDLSIHDNNGLRRAFVEAKAGRKASKSDLRQTLAAVDLTRKQAASKVLHVVARNGKEFFTKAQRGEIRHAAGKDVRVRYWTTRQLGQLAAELKKTVNRPAPRTSQQLGTKSSVHAGTGSHRKVTVRALGKPNLKPSARATGPGKSRVSAKSIGLSGGPTSAASRSSKPRLPAASGATKSAKARPAVSRSGNPLLPTAPAAAKSAKARPALSRSGKPLLPTVPGAAKSAKARPALSPSGKPLMPTAPGAAKSTNLRPAISPSGKPLMPSPSPAPSTPTTSPLPYLPIAFTR